MLLSLFPTLLMIGLIAWFVMHQTGRPVVQIHAVIVASYLNIFPVFDYILSDSRGMDEFGRYQLLVMVFFQIPFLLVAFRSLADSGWGARGAYPVAARLSVLLPWCLGGGLLVFWFVALEYHLFFRRLGHEALQQATADVPGVLLYLYRCAVETAFFVIIYLWTTVRSVAQTSKYYSTYSWLLRGYLVTFLLFFAANSRMQFVLLLLCLLCTQQQISGFFLKRHRLMYLALSLVVLVFGLTLFRELILEHNDRISINSVFNLLFDTSCLIATRLDSLKILYSLSSLGFNPWGFELSGVTHVLNFYISFFFDPQTYAAIKESLVTSPSVKIVNGMLPVPEVDFPKSMILDIFLSFGVIGLTSVAVLLGCLVGFVQRQLNYFCDFKLTFVLSLYLLPMLLEFEKEFIGSMFAFFKWSPVLLLLYWHRPRFWPACVVSSDSVRSAYALPNAR